MQKICFSLFVFLLLGFPMVSSAQDDNPFRSITSSLVTFASDDNVSTGDYQIKNDDEDTDIALHKIVIEVPVANRDGQYVPLVEVSPGCLKVEGTIRDEFGVQQGDVKGYVRGIGLGSGLRIKFLDEALEITPRFKVEYADVDYDVNIFGVDSEIIGVLVPDFKTWSYIPSLEAEYHYELAEDAADIGARSRISFVYIDANTSSDAASGFSSKNWVWRNVVDIAQPLISGTDRHPLIIKPSIGRVDIHGSARNGLEFGNFWEFGTEFVTETVLTDYFEDLAVGATWIYEKEVQGWRFEVTGSFN